MRSVSFKDFSLKESLLKAIADSGFEHPSEVQQECIPKTAYGDDILAQSKSGMGKTAIYVLGILNRMEEEPLTETGPQAIVLTHTRELAFQAAKEFVRFGKYLPKIKTYVIYGGISIEDQKKKLKEDQPHILIGTPGRMATLVKNKSLVLDKVKYFVIDECDQMLKETGIHLYIIIDIREDVQYVFCRTPRNKQVMMLSATLPKELREICKKFLRVNAFEVFIDNEAKLTLHGLKQFLVKLEEKEKNRKLVELLDNTQFVQVIIFVNSTVRAKLLSSLLRQHNFPAVAMHGDLRQEERLIRYKQFKECKTVIMISTDIFGRGVDIDKIDFVINYDLPRDSDTYMHRVGRAGRFGTKGLAVSFVATKEDEELMGKVQERFEIKVPVYPDKPDTAVLSTCL